MHMSAAGHKSLSMSQLLCQGHHDGQKERLKNLQQSDDLALQHDS